jgi:hypothetical protein
MCLDLLCNLNKPFPNVMQAVAVVIEETVHSTLEGMMVWMGFSVG